MSLVTDSTHSVFDGHSEICAFPPLLTWPEECEDGLASGEQGGGRQIEDVDSQAGVVGIGVMGGLPIVDAPMHQGRREQHDAQRFVPWDASGLVVESPAENLACVFLVQIALNGLRGLVEDSSVADGTAELNVLRVRPDEWACRTGRLAAEQLERREDRKSTRLNSS